MKYITVAAAVFIHDGKVFAAQRKNAGELACKWEFPGGKLEQGETGEQAVVREVKEELSADICVKRYLMTVEHQYQTFHITMHAYVCEIVTGELVLSEHIDSRWLSRDELYSVDWAAADQPILVAIESLLED